MAGLWSTSLGFSEQRLIDAATKQLAKLPYSQAFGGRSHEPCIDRQSLDRRCVVDAGLEVVGHAEVYSGHGSVVAGDDPNGSGVGLAARCLLDRRRHRELRVAPT